MGKVKEKVFARVLRCLKTLILTAMNSPALFQANTRFAPTGPP